MTLWKQFQSSIESNWKIQMRTADESNKSLDNDAEWPSCDAKEDKISI